MHSLILAFAVFGAVGTVRNAPPTRIKTYGSPEAAYEGFVDAFGAHDWDRALGALTPQSRNSLVGYQVYWGYAATLIEEDAAKEAALCKLLKKHHVDPSWVLSRATDNIEEYSNRLLADVSDRTRFTRELVTWLSRNLTIDKMGFKSQFLATTYEDMELKNVRISGDRAVGVLKENGEEFTFKRSSNGWLLDLAESLHLQIRALGK